MRCYKGKCRLADDPESLACTDEKSKNEASTSAQIIETKTPTPTLTVTPAINKTTVLQSGINKFLSNFSWQWLAIAGGILLVAITLIVISITKAKKDPWQNPVNKPEESPKETIEIPEDKPTQI